MGIIIGSRITAYTKTDNQGYHAENGIFGDEEFMARLPMFEDMKMPHGKKIEYYCFSISSDNTYKIDVSRGEVLEKDKRPYNNYEVYKVYPVPSEKSYDARYQLMEAALKKRSRIYADLDVFVEAMCVFGKYIPEPLREKLIFSANDTVSSGVIPLNSGIPEPTDRYIKAYCASPETYFGRFDEVIKKYYAKGGFGGDEHFVFCKYMANYAMPCETPEEVTKHKISDRTIEFITSKGTPRKPKGYPEIGYLENKLYALAHINRAYKFADIDTNTKIWDDENILKIAEFINILKQEYRTSEERLKFLEYIRPSMNSKREYLFESLKNMLAGKSEDTSALALMCFYTKDFPYSKNDFTKQGADPFKEIRKFYRKEKPDIVAKKTLIKKVRRSNAGLLHTLRYRIFLR